jgi:hypothetical protein
MCRFTCNVRRYSEAVGEARRVVVAARAVEVEFDSAVDNLGREVEAEREAAVAAAE